jgi:hypothetical protein
MADSDTLTDTHLNIVIKISYASSMEICLVDSTASVA